MLVNLIRTMRPKQWLKNIFVFAPLVFDLKLTNLRYLLCTVAGFVLLCIVSGSVYIINDLADAEKDRQHPRKKHRPIASGDVPVGMAIAFVALLLPASITAGVLLHPLFGSVLIGYFVMQVAYSFVLKKYVILDVMVIATGFVLRVAAGVPLVDAERFSPWMYTCMALLALFIGFSKRRHELVLLEGNANAHRESLQEYSLPFLDQVISIIIAATVTAYAFYTFSAPNLPENHSMMLTIPFLLYSLFRYLYLVQVKGLGGEPADLVLQDHPLQIGFLLWGASVVVIMYLSR